MVKIKKNEHDNLFKKINPLCKESSFNTRILNRPTLVYTHSAADLNVDYRVYAITMIGQLSLRSMGLDIN